VSEVTKDRFGNNIPEWYAGYVRLFGQKTVMEALQESMDETVALISSMDESKIKYTYEEGKWTVAEVLIHLIDCERIFTYRALRFARNDATPLPGFNENDYAPNSFANSRSLNSILEEYISVRKSSLTFFGNLQNDMWSRTGIANGLVFSVEMIATVIYGHETHHLKVLRERYGV
jgi:hypothetical protein